MSLALAWRFARRELRGGLAGFRIFLACLALGVATIAAIGSVRASIEAFSEIDIGVTTVAEISLNTLSVKDDGRDQRRIKARREGSFYRIPLGWL